jgi:hypothetical protein
MKGLKKTPQTRKCSRKNPVLSKSKPNRIPANRQKEQHKRAALPPQN